MNKKLSAAEVLKEAAILTTAVAIIAAAVYFFLVPSHTSVSSISGLGIVLSNFVPLPLSTITMILNVVLLLIGFLTCGREFGAKTVYTSVMLPVFLGLFERLFPDFASLTGSQTLDVLCYILVVSIGLSILFNRNASSGGLDIVAKILNKYLRIELGRAMSLAGMCVALSAALASSPRRRRNSAGSSSTTCTAAPRSTKRSAPITSKNTTRSSPSSTKANTRSS